MSVPMTTPVLLYFAHFSCFNFLPPFSSPHHHRHHHCELQSKERMQEGYCCLLSLLASRTLRFICHRCLCGERIPRLCCHRNKFRFLFVLIRSSCCNKCSAHVVNFTRRKRSSCSMSEDLASFEGEDVDRMGK